MLFDIIFDKVFWTLGYKYGWLELDWKILFIIFY